MWSNLLEDVKRALQVADHMLYVTYPVLKDNRLMIRALEKIYYTVEKTIDFIIDIESRTERINISSDTKINPSIFDTRCAGR